MNKNLFLPMPLKIYVKIFRYKVNTEKKTYIENSHVPKFCLPSVRKQAFFFHFSKMKKRIC